MCVSTGPYEGKFDLYSHGEIVEAIQIDAGSQKL